MPLRKHHKIMIGSFSTIVIIFMVINTAFIYLLFLNYNTINSKLITLEEDTASKINDLTESVLQTRELVNTEVGSLNQELSLLKATAGDDFSGIIDESIPAVVTIRTDAGFQGTGFIITSKGYLVTNAHVLADEEGRLARGIQAITYEQKSRNAEFIGYNSEFDVALLKISGDYASLEFGNSNDIQIGEKVIAIGNPLGLQFSVSEGIVSAVHRPGINDIEAYIQTDAALNPGNSGGPLINKQGKVIGINNFKIAGGESLGFSLESNYLIDSVNKITLENINQTLIN